MLAQNQSRVTFYMMNHGGKADGEAGDGCASLEELYLFVSGNLDALGRRAGEIERHLSGCQECAIRKEGVSRRLDWAVEKLCARRVRRAGSTASGESARTNPGTLPNGGPGIPAKDTGKGGSDAALSEPVSEATDQTAEDAEKAKSLAKLLVLSGVVTKR